MRPFDPRLMKHSSSTKKYVLLTGITGFITALLIISQSILISKIISPIINHDKFSLATNLIFMLVAVFILRLIITYINDSIAHKSATQTITVLREKLLKQALTQGPRWQKQNTAELTTLATQGLNNLVPYYTEYLPQLFLSATVTPVALLIVATYDIWSAITIGLTLPLIPIFMWLIGVMTQNYANSKLQTLQKLTSQLLDLISGLTTLKTLNREKSPIYRIHYLGKQYKKTTMDTLKVAFLSGAVLELLTTICVALVAVNVGMRLVYGYLDLEIGLIIIMLAPEVFAPIRQVGVKFHASADGVAAATKTLEFLEEETPENGSTDCLNMYNTDIKIENLSIYSRNIKTPNNLTATIKAKEITAITGENGAGKTTTTLAILKLIQPDEGKILLEDTNTKETLNLKDVEKTSLHQQITWVSQNPIIFQGSILENIQSFTNNYSLEKIEEIAEKTGLLEVVKTLEDKWDTKIGTNGVGLSLGQRQKIALTKALLDNKQIIILDEPTAHLDAQNEQYIIETIKELKKQEKTIILIAHKQSLINIADNNITVVAKAK